MTDIKFCLEEIDRTFSDYKNNKLYNAIVIAKREDGVIVNIGGKSDAIILKDEFENFSSIKIGDMFNVILTNKKTDDDTYVVSKKKAEVLTNENQIIKGLKLGSIFSFVPFKIENNCLVSKLGEFKILVPYEEIDNKPVNPKNLISKQCRGIVVEINNEDKSIIASIKTLKLQEKEFAETNFWKSIFINKVVEGTVEKILPYGAFINVDGVTCFIHISDISYSKIQNPNEVINENEIRKFRVIKVDRENKKVNLGIKQLGDNPKLIELKKLNVGDELKGKIVKLLQYGVIVKINENLEGLLHMYDVTDNRNIPVHQMFRVDDEIDVVVKQINIELQRVNFSISKENI